MRSIKTALALSLVSAALLATTPAQASPDSDCPFSFPLCAKRYTVPTKIAGTAIHMGRNLAGYQAEFVSGPYGPVTPPLSRLVQYTVTENVYNLASRVESAREGARQLAATHPSMTFFAQSHLMGSVTCPAAYYPSQCEVSFTAWAYQGTDGGTAWWTFIEGRVVAQTRKAAQDRAMAIAHWVQAQSHITWTGWRCSSVSPGSCVPY